MERIRQAACRDKEVRFTALWHHVYNVDRLREAYFSLKRHAAPGIDGETWPQYGENLEENLQDLADRLRRGAYRARPVRRVYIPKPDGRQRPLGVTTLEDKLVQRATAEVLMAVYETDFVDFSYGFRPGRSPHQALDALAAGIQTRKGSGVLDADIRGFLDLWADQWRRQQARGDVVLVRFADDFVVGFQYRTDAERFLAELRERLRKFRLELHAGKPETFDFLGFTHVCDQTRNGHFIVLRQTMRTRLCAKLKAIKDELRRRMHDPIPLVGRWLKSVLQGHYGYYAVPRNQRKLKAFRYQVFRLWFRTLRRRSQRHRITQERMDRLARRWLPSPRILHPYPEQRLAVLYPR